MRKQFIFGHWREVGIETAARKLKQKQYIYIFFYMHQISRIFVEKVLDEKVLDERLEN